MKRRLKQCARALWPLLAAFVFCEYLVYWPTLWMCSYPGLPGEPVRAMFVADTHLLGRRNGHWFDKLRREWQMRRAFQTAYSLFRPKLVVFLGDLFDEGKWSPEEEFEETVQRFKYMFSVDEAYTTVKVVAGNHDMGFHYAVSPRRNERFRRAFDVTGVDLFVVEGVPFVGVNSMAMEGDGCFLCVEAEKRLEEVTKELECMRAPDNEECELNYDFSAEKSPPPVLLSHFPLFRRNDQHCKEPDEAAREEKANAFRPKWDCLSLESTDLLLNKLRPRLAITGHTHNGCKTTHKANMVEWSLSSFSWRNRNNPALLLAEFTKDSHAVEKCLLPEEATVINVYWFAAAAVIFSLCRSCCWNTRRRRWL